MRIAVGVVVCVLMAGRAAAQSPNCIDRVSFEGEAVNVARTRDALATSLLAELPGSACDGVKVRVLFANGAWSFELRKDSRSVRHSVRELAAMVTWVESWLASEQARERGDSQTSEVHNAGQGALASAQTTPPSLVANTRREPTSRTIPIQLSLRGVLDVDSVGPLWTGVGLALRLALEEGIWFGVAGAIVWVPGINDVRRRAMRLSARLGWLESQAWGAFSLAGGVGIVSANAEDRRDKSMISRDDEAGPFVEAVAGLDVHLGAHWTLSFATVGRVYVKDEYGPSPDDAFEDPEPKDLSVLGASMEVGLAWDFARSL